VEEERVVAPTVENIVDHLQVVFDEREDILHSAAM
jgi:hypothetical protein